MKKKADLTSKQLVTIIVLIASFAVILIFYWQYNWTGTIDKEVCHQSVVMRSTFNYGPFEPGKEVIPLKCKTEKICLTMSGEDCEEFGKPSKKNPITKIKVKNKEDIMEAIANAMYECHSMLGEGKLNFMPHKFWDTNYCLICSRFTFDEEAKDKIGEIGYGELYKYLQEKRTPQGQSYLEYLYPGWKNSEKSKELFKNLQDKSENPEFKKLRFEDWKINLHFNQGYAIVSQMITEGTFRSWGKSIMIFVTAAGLSITGIGTPIGIGLMAGAVFGGLSLWYSYPGSSGDFVYSPPAVYPYDVDSLKALKCYSFEIAP